MSIRKIGVLILGATLFFIVAPYLTTMLSWRSIVTVEKLVPECGVATPSDENSKLCKNRYNMKMKEYRAAQFAYNTEHIASVYYWQRISTVASFFVLVFLVSSGVVLAIVEFNKGKGGENTLKISKDGLEISSEIIGLIVLAMSLVFAYVYIDKIYPINNNSRSAAVVDKPDINDKTDSNDKE